MPKTKSPAGSPPSDPHSRTAKDIHAARDDAIEQAPVDRPLGISSDDWPIVGGPMIPVAKPGDLPYVSPAPATLDDFQKWIDDRFEDLDGMRSFNLQSLT